MKKIIILALLLTSVIANSQTLTKDQMCNALEATLQTQYSGVEVNYNRSTLIIVMPITTLARLAEVSVSDTRSIIGQDDVMNSFVDVFANEVRANKDAVTNLNEIGFNYITVHIQDTQYYGYKVYRGYVVELTYKPKRSYY